MAGGVAGPKQVGFITFLAAWILAGESGASLLTGTPWGSGEGTFCPLGMWNTPSPKPSQMLSDGVVWFFSCLPTPKTQGGGMGARGGRGPSQTRVHDPPRLALGTYPCISPGAGAESSSSPSTFPTAHWASSARRGYSVRGAKQPGILQVVLTWASALERGGRVPCAPRPLRLISQRAHNP